MEKIKKVIPLMVGAVLMTAFGLIACFANTQSIVSILLAGTLSTMYAVRAGGLENYVESIGKLFSGWKINFKNCVMILDLALEIVMLILAIISIIGLACGRIEASFINVFLPSWVMLMVIATIVFFIITVVRLNNKQETIEETEEEDEEEY